MSNKKHDVKALRNESHKRHLLAAIIKQVTETTLFSISHQINIYKLTKHFLIPLFLDIK